MAAAAVAVLTLVAGTANAQSSSSSSGSSTAQPDVCVDKIMLEVAPTNFSVPSLPTTIDPPGMNFFADELPDRGVHVESVPYNAMWLTGQISYNDSRDDGIARTEARMVELTDECPNSTIGLIGYSSGADITAQIAGRIGRDEGAIPAHRLGAVISMANPSRSTEGTYMAGTAGPGEGFFPPMDYGSVAGNVFELCDAPETPCNLSNIAPGARSVLVDNAFLTSSGLSSTAAGVVPDMSSADGLNTLANLIPSLLGISYHATAYWVNPNSPLYTEGVVFVMNTPAR